MTPSRCDKARYTPHVYTVITNNRVQLRMKSDRELITEMLSNRRRAWRLSTQPAADLPWVLIMQHSAQ